LERVQLAHDLSFSRIIQGFSQLMDWNMSKPELLSLIEHCMDRGITTFDHADIYGDYMCEQRFGEALALKPGLRSRMQIVTKFGLVKPSANRPLNKTRHYNTSKEHILRTVGQSLRNFGTDYIDVLLIHRPDPFMDPEQVAEAFDALRASGKVRYFGVSNFKFHQFNMLQSYLNVKLVTNQIELSAYRLENFEDGTLNHCVEKRIPPMAWSPLAKGKIFTGEDEKAVRLRGTLRRIAAEIGTDQIGEVMYAWLLRHPAKIMPIIGTGKKERVDQAVRACGYRLTLDQWFEIYQSSAGHQVP
jgi:Predicted oxidoreductase